MFQKTTQTKKQSEVFSQTLDAKVAKLVAEKTEDRMRTDKVKVPGLEFLHTKSKAEIAEVLTTVLKSRQNIKKFSWELGKPFIEVVYEIKTNF